MPFTNHDEYPVSPPSTTTSSTDSQHVDAQAEANPAFWGAVRSAADWCDMSEVLIGCRYLEYSLQFCGLRTTRIIQGMDFFPTDIPLDEHCSLTEIGP